MNVRLQWNRNVEPDVTAYNIYRGTVSGGPYTQVNASLVSQTPVGTLPTYTDVTPDGRAYYYVVRAVNVAGVESTNSNEAVAIPPANPPAPPTGLVVTDITATLSLSVDGSQVAMKVGEIPLALTYNLRRTTPPRDRLLLVTAS